MRTHWDGKDEGELRERVAAYAAIGVQPVMIAPVNCEVDDWDEVIDGAGRLAAARV
jgi:ParB-like chromosome segregation protein Spo0J